MMSESAKRNRLSIRRPPGGTMEDKQECRGIPPVWCARSETRLRMRERFGMHPLTQTPSGGRVICEQRELLYEEAPTAYKNIEDAVQDMVEAGLVSVVATFRPLLTYKTRAAALARDSKPPSALEQNDSDQNDHRVP
jgi:hypothetical protein